MTRLLVRSFCFLAVFPSVAMSYNTVTHEELSRAAVLSSGLRTDSGILESLGLEPLGEAQTFSIDGFNERTIIQHVRDGSRIEDGGSRALNHFFDPLYDRGLFGQNPRSPDWALEDRQDFDDQFASFKDGREHFYHALTSFTKEERQRRFGLTFEKLGQVIHHLQDMAQPQHTRNDQHLDFPSVKIPGLENPSRYERHTRLVQGTPAFTGLLSEGLYPNVRFSSARRFWHTQDRNPMAGQGIAEFTNTNFVSFGTNFRGAFQNGELIAQRNERYPLPAPDPVTPKFENANTLLASVGRPVPPECSTQTCFMAFYSNEVNDNYRPEASGTNPRASTASIFDQDLEVNKKSVLYPNLDQCTDPTNPDTCEKVETRLIFSLNRFNFDAAHDFLIPRAVGYSAGLIDYFFRGRLEVVGEELVDDTIKLKIKNAIDPTVREWVNEALRPTGDSGDQSELVVAYEYKEGEEVIYGTSNPVRLTETILPGKTSETTYTFTFQEPLPPDIPDAQFRIVFRGRLGQEDNAVAVGVFKILVGFLLQPNYVPTDGITGNRLIYKRNGGWRLSKVKDLEAGNIDWKGWYVNGKPTKVLTWSGPSTRHFPDRPGKPFHQVFRSEIFQNGEVHADAPLPVLGAALTKAADGSEWIVAICSDGIEDIVYRRPNKKTDSSELFDPVMNPEGWQEIDRFPPEPEFKFADRPWFFNGSGTKALTLRRLTIDPTRETAGGDKTTLLEIEILDASSAIRTNRGNLGGHHQKTESVVTVIHGQSGNILSGTAHSTSSGQGRHIVAVDYLDVQERICTHERLINGAVAHVFSSSPVSRTTYDRTFDGVERIDCETFSINTHEFHQTRSVRHAPDSTFTTSRDADIQLVVEFIDLRYDLIAFARSENRVAADLTSDPAAAIQCGAGFLRGSGARRSSSQELEQIDFGGQLLGVFDAEEISESSLNCFSIVPFTATKSSVTTSEFATYPSIVGGSRAVGGWALDSKGNFIASQIEGAFHFNQVTGGFGTGKYFNHLTGGDLSSIISGAPGDARYYPVAVIH